MSYNSVLAGLTVVSDLALDEASGTTATASVGTNGTIAGTGVTYAAAPLLGDGGTGALVFDGGSGEVTVPTTGLLSTAGALAFWCSNTDAMMVRDHVTTTSGWLLASNGTNVTVRANVNTSRNTPTLSSTVNDGVRHFFVVTTDGTTCKVYIDGAVVDSFAAAQAFSTIHSPMHFGRSGNNLTVANYFAGTYDRITFFGQNLSSTDVTNLWNAGSATGNTGTLATTLAGATLAAVAKETFTGTLAATLAGSTLAASGTVANAVTGTLAVTLAGATLAGTGAEKFTGTFAATLGGATLAATGSTAAPVTGTLATTFSGATLTASGVEKFTGTLAVTLDNATVVGAGLVANPITGTLTVTLDGATLTGAGSTAQNITGTLAATLADVILAATGNTHQPFRDIKVLAVVDVSRAITPVDVSRNPTPVESPRPLTITEEVYA